MVHRVWKECILNRAQSKYGSSPCGLLIYNTKYALKIVIVLP